MKIRFPYAVLALVVALPSVSGAEILDYGTHIEVVNHRGGNVLEMVGMRSRLERSGKEVRIRGYCRSACTMLLTMRNACIAGDAAVGFHAPRIPNTNIIPPYVDQVMGYYYRGGILEKWNSEWKYSLDMHKISAEDYVKLDPQARICGR
ncbi:hypothetical protein [Paracoccus aerodenitrificans]|uniref:hypothetical protein n=1 Tax=Paracoccus aerodenitrificans TaxID=3017781 RepID=UPI0022F0097B|nr:hypothetical protein [Paracoccus aerodenitrificans]WBU63756.1 hypothetical protein PAE61_15680 [Paracoccus aerodenitrificans]